MEGQQFVVRPQRANQGLEIAEGEFLTVTMRARIFSAVCTRRPDGRGPVAAMDGSAKNIFETVSEFLVWAETGVQSGSQEALENLKTASEGLLTSLAAVGGKEQRAELNLNILENSRYDMEDRMSTIEDVDLTELVTKLAAAADGVSVRTSVFHHDHAAQYYGLLIILISLSNESPRDASGPGGFRY